MAVTGAGGFIAGKLCARLAEAGAEIRGLEVDGARRSAVEAAGAEFVQCDTTDRAGLGPALDGATLVAHTAALVGEWGARERFVAVNVGGTANVIDAATEAGAKRILHVSSVAAFGYDHPDELDEDAEPRPCGIPYIDTKGASDRLARQRAAAGAPLVVVRPGDVYGPGSDPWTVRPLRLIKAGRFVLVGKGDGLITPVYVDDLVEAFVLALTTDGVEGRAFNVWDGQAVTTAEFIGHYARMVGRDRIPHVPRAVALALGAALEAWAHLTGRPPDFQRASLVFLSRRAPYSIRLARELLGWEPRVGLEEGMARTEAWARAEGLL